MRLLSVIASMNPESGGPAQGINNNLPFWRAAGIEANVLCFDDTKTNYTQCDHIIAKGPVRNKWAYVPRLHKWLLDHLPSYDVVLIHGLWLYNGYATTKAISQLKREGKKIPKVFIMPHGMLDPYFQKAPDRKIKAIRNVIYWHLVEKKVVNHADGILFTCEEELQLAKTTFSGYNPKATYNVGYGIVPPPPFSPSQEAEFYKKCPLLHNRPYFLFLSRIHPKKGVDILLQAYAFCYDYYKEKGIILPNLVVAGPGMDSEYGKYLMILLDRYERIKEKVHFPGMLQGDVKWGAIYRSELFILPSHQENFGIAIVEAMACSKPVIITDKVNIWREISHLNAGIIVKDELESLIKALKEWQGKTSEEKNVMNENAYATYESFFTASSTSQKFIEVIEGESLLN